MTTVFQAARQRTMYFIGVTTGKSSINQVFPKWAEELNLNATLTGIDFLPNDEPEKYRQAVQFIKDDELSLGALVTTHKIDLYQASSDLLDGIGPYARLLGEVSTISKRGDELWGHAIDPITSGISLDKIVDETYWARTDGEMLVLGAGGASLALTLNLHHKKKGGGEVPKKLYVTDIRPQRLDDMKSIHKKIDYNIPITYELTPTAEDSDLLIRKLPPYSMVINATGVGKDRPGSPLTDEVDFPENTIVWDFNYRGDLVFLDQARNQSDEKNLTVEDGWDYFIYGWASVIAEVFHIDVPTAGPEFQRLSRAAAQAVGRVSR